MSGTHGQAPDPQQKERDQEVRVGVRPSAGDAPRRDDGAAGGRPEASGDSAGLLHSNGASRQPSTESNRPLVPDEWETAATLAQQARDGRLDAAREGMNFCAEKCSLGMKTAFVPPATDWLPSWSDDQAKAVLELLLASSACLGSTATSGAVDDDLAATLNLCLMLAARFGSDEAARLCLLIGSQASTRLLVGERGVETPAAAAICARSLRVLHLLACAGADLLDRPEDVDGAKVSLADLARERGFVDGAEYMSGYVARLSRRGTSLATRLARDGVGMRLRDLLATFAGEAPLVDVNRRDEHSAMAPLHAAASSGHVAICKFLVSTHGATVDVEDGSFRTPLMLAYAKGHTEAAEALLALGAVLARLSSNQGSALTAALESGLTATAHALERGAADRLTVGQYARVLGGATDGPAKAALAQRMADVVQRRTDVLVQVAACPGGEAQLPTLVADFGALPTSPSSDAALGGRSAVTAAADAGYLPSLSWLVARAPTAECLTQATRDTGMNALHLACAAGHFDCAKALLDKGSSMRVATSPKGAPSAAAGDAAAAGDVSVAPLRVDDWINRPSGVQGLTAAGLAICGGHTDVVELLISRGADAWAGTTSPLVLAARHCHPGLLRFLLRRSRGDLARVNWKDADGCTALMAASASSATECVEALLGAGADWQACDLAGSDALACAARARSIKCLAQIREQRDAHFRNVAEEILRIVSATPSSQSVSDLQELLGREHEVAFLAPRLFDDAVEHTADARGAADTAQTDMGRVHAGLLARCLVVLSGAADLHRVERTLDKFVEAAIASATAPRKAEVTMRRLVTQADLDPSACRATDGECAMCAASAAGAVAVVTWLAGEQGTSAGAARLFSGETAVMLASQGGHADVVATLLEHGADPRVACFQGKTALSQASGPAVAALLASWKPGAADPVDAEADGSAPTVRVDDKRPLVPLPSQLQSPSVVRAWDEGVLGSIPSPA